MTSLKLCMIAPDFMPVWSGIGSYRIHLARYLPRDIELHVLTTERKMNRAASQSAGSINSFLEWLDGNVQIHRICEARSTFLYHAAFQFACLRTLPTLQRRIGFDLVHTDFPLMSDLLVQLLKRTKARTISTVHTTIEGQNLGVRRAEKDLLRLEQSDLANLMLVLPLKLCEYFYLRRVHHLITSSEYIKTELQECFPFLRGRYLPVVRYGIDTDLFSRCTAWQREDLREISSLDRPIVLFAGRLVASKGIHTLIQAIPKILHAHPSAVFLFAGGGDCRQYVRELRNRGVPRESYRFLGYVDYFDMPQVYSLASVFAVPTLYESLPLRILEAMSCETPTVATRVCGIPEMISHEEDGILIQPMDYEELAKSIVLLLEDNGLARKLGRKARQTVTDRFCARDMASRTMDVFKRCLESEA